MQRNCGVVVGIDYPKPIVEHSVVSKKKMAEMKEAYEERKASDATARVMDESASAKRKYISK